MPFLQICFLLDSINFSYKDRYSLGQNGHFLIATPHFQPKYVKSLKYNTEILELDFCFGIFANITCLLSIYRRNFPEELAAGKIIRLIFNGRMLRDDNITLQNYGLFDDCVVHCLIGNEKPQQPAAPEQPDQSQQYPQNNEQATVPEWNLSKLLCFLIVGILSLTWYCRFQFATLFTFTSTSFLLGLTVIFLCSMFGTFYVDSVPLNTVGQKCLTKIYHLLSMHNQFPHTYRILRVNPILKSQKLIVILPPRYVNFFFSFFFRFMKQLSTIVALLIRDKSYRSCNLVSVASAMSC